MRAICRVPERHAFCIFLSTPLALLPTSFCRVTSKSLDYPPSTSKMILPWLILYPGYLCFNSHLSGAYFMVFSEVFLSQVAHPGAAHLQGYHLLISVVNDPSVYSICSELLVLSIYRNIPIRLYLCCFID